MGRPKKIKEETGSIENYVDTIVIPYVSAKFDELEHAVKLWKKFYEGCKIVVIGDRPKFEGDFTYIPHEKSSDNPQIDVANKMLAIIESKEVPENFVWSNDDIFPVSKLLPQDVHLITANGSLSEGGGSLYSINRNRTIKSLQDAGFKTYDYSTHTPMLFNKSKLKEIIEKYGADKEGYLVSSLYFNTLYPCYKPLICDGRLNDPYSANIWRANVQPHILKACFERKFINVQDLSYPQVVPMLKKLLS